MSNYKNKEQIIKVNDIVFENIYTLKIVGTINSKTENIKTISYYIIDNN